MRALLEKYKWLKLIIGAAIIALGIVTIVLGLQEPGKVTSILCVIWGIFCFLAAFFAILSELVGNPRSPLVGTFISAGITIGLGIFFVWEGGKTAGAVLTGVLLQFLLPWVLVGIGSVLIVKSLALLAASPNKAIGIIYLGVAVAILAVGLVLWFCRDDLDKFVYIVLGVLITAAGVMEVASAFVALSRKGK